MKQILITFFAVLIFTACNNSTKESAVKDSTTKAVTIAMPYLPYPIGYASNFEIADNKYSKIVLDLWKSYENNDLKSTEAFADTMTLQFANGALIKKQKDSMNVMIAAQRSKFASVTSSIDVIVALKPKGKDVIWVCVWGKEVDVMKDGKKDSLLLNENWMFNKDGKIAMMHSYNAKDIIKK